MRSLVLQRIPLEGDGRAPENATRYGFVVVV